MRFFITFFLLLLPLQSMAGDLSATFDNHDGSTFTISARDLQHVRMDTGEGGYTLLKGDKTYMVNSDGAGGWNVIDMAQMAGMMGMVSGGDDDSQYTAKYRDLGRSERIAGYTGNVYEVEVTEDGKLVSRDEVVLSNHGDIEQLNKAWMALAKQMTGNMGMNMTDILAQSENHGYGGLLRYGNDMTMKSLSKASLPANYFDLPSNAQQTNMAQSPTPPEQHEETMVEQDAKDIGQAAHDEAKQSTIEEVQEGVSDVFKSIFN